MAVEELHLQSKKVRLYTLADELKLDTKDLLTICKQAGLDVKTPLSSVDRDQVIALVKRGPATAPAAPSKPAAPASLPDVGKTVPVLQSRPVRKEPEPRTPPPPPAPEPTPAPPEPVAQPAPEPEKPAAPPPPLKTPTPPVPTLPSVRAGTPPTLQSSAPKTPATLPAAAKTGESPGLKSTRRPRDLRPTGVRMATPPPLRPSVPPTLKKAPEPVQKPIGRLTPEQLAGDRPLRPEDILKPVVPGVAIVDDEDEAAKKARGKAVPGRDKRQQARNERAKQRKDRVSPVVEVHGGKAITLDDDRPQTTRKLIRHKLKHRQQTQPRKGKIPVDLPITVRSLSQAMGVSSGELLMKLMGHGQTAQINSSVDPEMAELLAVDFGCELEIKKGENIGDRMLAELDKPDSPEDLLPRAPIVTIMGHVDHGKTSLLDKIRRSNVAASEAGGITQVLRAWRVEHMDAEGNVHPITFLDTPGHEAFTKMRARGAQVTDIAVIVVAADDGVMPQTEEAIHHARAAGVSLVVAINKVDLPSANLNRTRQQLYGLNILPDNMGGDTPFVETSAATGKGIDDLLESLSVVAELKELKANPNKAGRGSCLEAMLSEGEGVTATVLVREGTLRKGDVIVCGPAYGRVRQMYSDMGVPLEEAGPSVPARITGLDVVPNADDPFVVVPDLAVARSIADKRKTKQQEATLQKRVPLTLENLTQAKVAELKVILKADFRGSIEAIRKELEKFQHAEVRIRILETATGAITENDVWLALTSPEDTLIVGFNVVPDDRARVLAEEKGVQIRLYDIIYNLTNDIRAALEGKLKPREEVINLGRAVVRDTFKISRVGTIAGCFVTEGVIKRSAKVRLIRGGVVIYPPADRTAGLDSLKRFKEDVGEVREGFECGIKIANYDDIKVGDIIEAFRIEQVQRTL